MPPAARERVARLRPNESLLLMPEIGNEYDSQAVAVRTADIKDRYLIGYVPRYLAREVRLLCAQCEPDSINLQVEKFNPEAPLQHRLLCRLRTCWPQGFAPCDDDAFNPIVNSSPSVAH